MRKHEGWWLPDYEEDMLRNAVITEPTFKGRKTYQLYAVMSSLNYVRNFRHAVDVGAHVGLWSHVLSHLFDKVSAFEPVPYHAECFDANIPATLYPNVSLARCALGDFHLNDVAMALKAPWSLKARVQTKHDDQLPSVKVDVWKLDEFKLKDVDFIKLDCEGYEYFAVKGGEETIRRCKPFVVVEQKPLNTVRYGEGDTAAVELLTSWGAETVWAHGGDYFMRWS